VEWLGRDHFPAYFALYEHVPSIGDIVSRVGVAGIARSILFQFSVLGKLTVTDASLLAIVPASLVLGRRNGAFGIFGMAFVVSLAFLTCVVHHVEYRYLSPLIAFGAVGIGGVVEELEQWVRARFPGRASVLRTAVLCVLAGYTLFAGTRRYRDLVEMGASMTRPDECGQASYFISKAIPKDEAVLTTNGWFVSWKTERAAVQAPTNGEDAILTVARHYDARWAMTGKPVLGELDLERALASPKVASALQPHRVYWGQTCNVYRLHPSGK